MYMGYRIRSADAKLQGLLRNINAKKITADIPSGLADYLRSGGEFDGNKVEDKFFPTDMRFDVFISHFHRDEQLARKLAAYLQQTFGLEVFLDFQYWGCYKSLLAEIDRNWNYDENYAEHGFKKGELLNHPKCTFSASVMHMMLGVALARMIQSTECVIFVHSENEKLTDSYKNELDEIELGSPWVYHELWMTKLLAPSEKTSSRYEKLTEAVSKSFAPRLNAPVKQLSYLDGEMIVQWENKWKMKRLNDESFDRLAAGNALDILYGL